ncbi:sulfate transporter family-domain-containing protein [Obelidium mucronatum]|nr:sulfate transporter family-domain-containing protein [Obelidium mucronatum]
MSFAPETQIQYLKRRVTEGTDLKAASKEYVKSLFPIFQWIHRYNLRWFLHDFIAGITVALVVIPQAISYATKLVGLPPQFGLYTSFIGCLIYAVFATSKDVTIGPTAVQSLLVGQTIATYIPNATPAEKIMFAITLAFWSGVFQTFVGVFRLGVIVDFVPVPVIAGFTSGAGVQIIIQQLPGLFGIKGINTNSSPSYQVLYDFFSNIGNLAKYDAIFGVSAFFLILIVKYSFHAASKKVDSLKYIGFLCYALALIVFTSISYVVRDNKDIPLSIVKTIPYGLSGIQQANVALPYASTVFPAIPAVFVVGILEHIAVVKTYGRINGYTTDSNQEILAIGLTNVIASFVGGFPATASFSRSAIKSSCDVKTPLGTFFTGILVVIGLFTFTNVLYYIPTSVLAAIVITAIFDLFVNFTIIKSLWEVDIFDFIGFMIALITTWVANIEYAIYASVAWSLLVLLLRIARPRVNALVRTPSGDWMDPESVGFKSSIFRRESSSKYIRPDGILVFKIDESLTYPNSGYFTKRLKQTVIENFKYNAFHIYKVERKWDKSGTEQRYKYKTERSWNDDTEERVAERERQGLASLPPLRAIVLDFSSVSHVDYTGLQALLDAKDDVERFTGRAVPFHFANVRRNQLNALIRVHGIDSGHSLDATPGAPAPATARKSGGFIGFLKSALQTDYEEIELKQRREAAALEYFHFNVDDAVEAAHEETKSLLALMNYRTANQ